MKSTVVPPGPNAEDFVVVMTATITPAPGVHVLRCDPEVRKRDYLEALQFWLDLADPRLQKIVFLENSGAPLDGFAALAARSAKAVELIAVPPSPVPANFHYGYGEMKAIEYGLGHSHLLKEAKLIIKATGRLKFPGLVELLDRLPGGLEIAVDCRNRGRIFGSKRGFAPTQLFIVAKGFYLDEFATAYDRMHEGYFMEQLIYDRLLGMPRSPRRVLRWPVSVEP